MSDMIRVRGGTFSMGATGFYPEEGPVRRVAVDDFWIDQAPVTNAEFRRFVRATGHVTVAERPVTRADYPDADPSLLVPGSLVFERCDGPVDLRDVRNWWSYVPGASWRAPEGPGSGVEGRDAHPVVHVAYEDAEAYARWAGKDLASEAEWEYAARGGLDGATYAWGDELAPGGRLMANLWYGQFPWQKIDGAYERTSPVGAFPANGYGLYDMVGNVWEWTSDAFGAVRSPTPAKACCSGARAREAQTAHTARPEVRQVVKGGSFLCAPNYCRRYRPAARQGETVDTSSSHIGFRCIVRARASLPATRA
jgi:formylglycine-generating enzyme required for sulfatase activity